MFATKCKRTFGCIVDGNVDFTVKRLLVNTKPRILAVDNFFATGHVEAVD